MLGAGNTGGNKRDEVPTPMRFTVQWHLNIIQIGSGPTGGPSSTSRGPWTLLWTPLYHFVQPSAASHRITQQMLMENMFKWHITPWPLQYLQRSQALNKYTWTFSNEEGMKEGGRCIVKQHFKSLGFLECFCTRYRNKIIVLSSFKNRWCLSRASLSHPCLPLPALLFSKYPSYLQHIRFREHVSWRGLIVYVQQYICIIFIPV